MLAYANFINKLKYFTGSYINYCYIVPLSYNKGHIVNSYF